ncbi:MAG: hypothetical protein ACI9FN_003261 [Saprospiraceae bacterium]|jgi:hypothetical protein
MYVHPIKPVLIAFLFLSVQGVSLLAQIGGINTFHFLNLSPSARITALGGANPSIADDDITQALANPALINEKMRHQAAINHRFHVADISHGTVTYGLPLDSVFTLLLAAQYVDLGQFERADEFGNRDGFFDGSEVAVTIGSSYKLDDRLRIGLNLKYVSSVMETYSSNGLGGDIGFHYFNPDNQANWSMVLKNIGGQISSYNVTREALPIEFQIGYAKRLKHLPFRFLITARNIQNWKLTYESELNQDLNIINGSNNESGGLGKIVDNLFRHLTFGGELLIGPREGFRVRMGYSHQRNKELSTGGYRSLSGLSIGFGVRVKRFMFNYGYSRFHLAGNTSHIGFSMNLTKMK